MDGNGRWAKQQNQKRSFGHKKGAQTVQNITIHASNIKLKYLTLYAFSTENWKRPKHEIEFLMKLLDSYLKDEVKTYLDYNVKFNIIGDISKFSKKLQNRIEKTKELTKSCTGLIQTLAINYGSRDEIVRAIKKIIKTKNNEEINENSFNNFLDTHNLPDVDMLIRTGGTKRLSNFLLWQIAYAELFFTTTLWPDFNSLEFDGFIEKFKNIKRNFGAI